jgi:hypothetical protein
MAAGNWVDWNTGDLVTAASFQDIQDSIVFIYADDSAANTALTNKVEGTTYFDTTLNKLKVWDGSAWTQVGDGVGLASADQFNLTADITSPTTGTLTDITTNLARSTGTLAGGTLGSGMTLASGIFTFPSTGYWLVTLSARMKSNTSPTNMFVSSTDDNFSTETTIIVLQSYDADSGDTSMTVSNNALLDITDTANDKVKLSYALYGANSVIEGSAGNIETAVTFQKLGDT